MTPSVLTIALATLSSDCGLRGGSTNIWVGGGGMGMTGGGRWVSGSGSIWGSGSNRTSLYCSSAGSSKEVVTSSGGSSKEVVATATATGGGIGMLWWEEATDFSSSWIESWSGELSPWFVPLRLEHSFIIVLNVTSFSSILLFFLNLLQSTC